ncbi:DUF2513 domain-containing protein [Pseudovibrio sp. Tun.PSC04-5.I4]|uniref:DUF2513 domain-containing protein n=1 Tax=Pseudovibrio sp. Tun.PSC04-5.I4 TaxID=1798213 RepID=UPI0008832BBD|nr:DUF2513 domain-containing protein [Pseudovibrio sp. Tun.PSC04-5.I4]SDR15418.1 Hypothetical protein SAMN04515695_3051 [Pseudovibrio sp. Tun.PSC04-5.I4]
MQNISNKLDMNLLRELLLKIEGDKKIFETISDKECSILVSEANSMSEAEANKLEYHLQLLDDAGLIDGLQATNNHAYVEHITRAGHGFLDTVRDEGIWKRLKEELTKNDGAMLEILTNIAKALLKKKAQKQPKIGLKNIKQLCNMPYNDRIKFIAEGLPIILKSAQSLWHASQRLSDAPREANILIGLAKEEAAKILILMDIVRCPPKLVATKVKDLTGWFLSHHERLMYVSAARCRNQTGKELQYAIDYDRQEYYLEGDFGKYIMPNAALYNRERILYADVVNYDEGKPYWNDPTISVAILRSFKPRILVLIDALSKLGVFSHSGLKVVAEIWGNVTFSNKDTNNKSDTLARELLSHLRRDRLTSEGAEQKDVSVMHEEWPQPLYGFDLKPIKRSMSDLQEEQDRIFYPEMGGY